MIQLVNGKPSLLALWTSNPNSPSGETLRASPAPPATTTSAPGFMNLVRRASDTIMKGFQTTGEGGTSPFPTFGQQPGAANLEIQNGVYAPATHYW